MSAKAKKSWREKLADDKGLPKVIAIQPHQEKRWGRGTMVVPAPREVDALIRTIPRGETRTVAELCEGLAKGHGTDRGCPLTTGIFAWIAAHAAAEDEADGRRSITPWWRVLKTGGKLNPKFPGGIEEQARRLKSEKIPVAGEKVLDGHGLSGSGR